MHAYAAILHGTTELDDKSRRANGCGRMCVSAVDRTTCPCGTNRGRVRDRNAIIMKVSQSTFLLFHSNKSDKSYNTLPVDELNVPGDDLEPPRTAESLGDLRGVGFPCKL